MRTLFAPARVPDSALHAITEDRCFPRPSDVVLDLIYGEAAVGFVLSGWFEYRSESGTALAGPGAVLMGNAAEHFSVRQVDTLGNRRMVVLLKQAVLEDVANACSLDDARFATTLLPPARQSTLMCGLIRRLALGLPDQEDALYILAGEALKAGRTRHVTDRLCLRDERSLRAVVHYVHARFAEPCPLDLLADLAGMSRYHFVRRFHQLTGQSPNQYVIHRRLRAAADKLLETSTPITQVALEVGFNDLSHFYSCFRAVFGCTPRQWRRGRTTGREASTRVTRAADDQAGRARS